MGPAEQKGCSSGFLSQKLGNSADPSQLKERLRICRGSNPRTTARKTQAQRGAAPRRTLLSAAATGKRVRFRGQQR